jgi:hypothetical protein
MISSDLDKKYAVHEGHPSDWNGLCRGLPFGLAKVPGQQGFVIIDGLGIRQGREQIDKIAVGIDPVRDARLDERVQVSARFSPTHGVSE